MHIIVVLGLSARFLVSIVAQGSAELVNFARPYTGRPASRTRNDS